MNDRLRSSSPPAATFSWLPEFYEIFGRRFQTQGRVLAASLLVGVVAGLGAVLFAAACHVVVHFCLDVLAGYRTTGPGGEARVPWLVESNQPLQLWLLVLLPVVGGLLSGLIVFTLAPEAEGHGTDAAIDAYHNKQGEIRPRVPLVKLVASALTIGSGGSGGREGPIALIGAGFGSYLGKLLRLRSAERRVLVAAGMGAGVGAIFRAPLAGALFAAEILYRSPEFESEVILPAGLACVVSYCTFGLFYQGWKPLFDIKLKLGFDNPLELLPYLVLALWMALLAALYTRSFYGITRRFRKLPIPTVFKPAIGGLGTGLIGVLLYVALNNNLQALAVMSFGYGILQDGLLDPLKLSAGLLLAVALGKILTTSLTIGSGGSGGVFGPSMVIGGCGGLSLGLVLHSWWPSLVPQPANFMVLGMAGFFAAAGKVPFSTLVMVSEITGGYTLILPALWVCILSYLVSDEQSLYSAQVATRSRSPAHQGEYIRDVLTGFQVQQFLQPSQELLLVRPNDRLDTLLDVLDEGAGPVVAVVDDQQQLVGAVNLEEVYLAISSPNTRPWVLVADLMRSNIVPLQTTHRLDEALELFAENDLPALPVVEGPNSRSVVAMIRRGEIARQYVRLVHGKKPAESQVVATVPKE